MPQNRTITLSEDALHVIKDALAHFQREVEHNREKPWRDYDGEDGENPLATEDGYGEALDEAVLLVDDAVAGEPAAGPRVEVLVVRNPDAGTDVEVFVDGARDEASVEVVDPGAGHVLVEWMNETGTVGEGKRYSTGFRDAVVEARDAENGSEHISHF